MIIDDNSKSCRNKQSIVTLSLIVFVFFGVSYFYSVDKNLIKMYITLLYNYNTLTKAVL